MGKSKSTYEEIRRKTIAENKKRMQELNITKLSQNLISKPSLVKIVKHRISKPPVALISVRRSKRVLTNLLLAIKKSQLNLRRGSEGYCYEKRGLLNGIYASDEVRTNAIHRAEQIQSGLDADFPSFVSVDAFGWVCQSPFCKKHLSLSDEVMILEDENGEESGTKYLARKTGLSGGWMGFAINHELVDGDALVFQLVSPTKSQLCIIDLLLAGRK